MSEKINIYIVEDEAITVATIKSYLHQVGYEVCGVADEATAAWKDIQSMEVDLAILDINLIGEKDGIWLAQKIHELGTIPFVFLTAYGDRKTVESALTFKPDGYLIKPFEEMELYTAIKIALEAFANRSTSPPPAETDNMMVNESLFIKDEHILVKLTVDEIQFVKSDGNYLELHLSGKRHLIRSKLVDFAQRLPANFIQVHQRYLVNLSKVEVIGNGYLTVVGKEIPISKTFKDNLFRSIKTI
ncbi:LytTR family DNA-binding domain-containing protein [Marinoscillum sp. 108]|uniref:LytR/AlgR family response regulator transcription factor n=1 Tax=Marinoscillum sp. 108 TaxID=2653151 RepID=UPI0012F2496A|nr:response regulator [Marinoscillum sp. 108]VXD13732.1 Response regulator, LylTr family [Marinoscillum sp. 108]